MQFDEIVDRVGINGSASGTEKLKALRKLEGEFIEKFMPK